MMTSDPLLSFILFPPPFITIDKVELLLNAINDQRNFLQSVPEFIRDDLNAALPALSSSAGANSSLGKLSPTALAKCIVGIGLVLISADTSVKEMKAGRAIIGIRMLTRKQLADLVTSPAADEIRYS